MAKNAAAKTSALLSALKTSLPMVDPTTPLPTVHQGIRVPMQIDKPKTGSRAPKLSVSLYAYDLKCLDDIKSFMQDQGYRNLSDSEAIRLACRLVKVDGALVDAYKGMQAEDGRRKTE